MKTSISLFAALSIVCAMCSNVVASDLNGVPGDESKIKNGHTEDRSGDDLTWYTDMNEAVKVSRESGKPLFLFFTGSDWCGWCIRLQQAVFHKESFKTWAKDNVVLVELDFPRRKKLPDNIQQQNYELQQQLGVRGYPTVWLVKANQDQTSGQVKMEALGNLGYPQGCKRGEEDKKFISDATKIMSKKAEAK